MTAQLVTGLVVAGILTGFTWTEGASILAAWGAAAIALS